MLSSLLSSGSSSVPGQASQLQRSQQTYDHLAGEAAARPRQTCWRSLRRAPRSASSHNDCGRQPIRASAFKL